MSIINFNANASVGLSSNVIAPPTGINNGDFADNNYSDSTIGLVLDELANLIELNFDGSPFPAISFKENGSHDLAVHKYPNLDSARLENTGRNPSVFGVRGIFTNHIYPSVNETWTNGDLFPNTFNAVLTSLYDSTKPIKTLVHPYLGNINVMVKDWSYSFIGSGPRDGVFVDMVFMETLADNNIATTIAPPNPSAQLSNVASSLDDLIGQSAVPIQPPGMSLAGFFSSIANTVKQIMALPINPVNALLVPIFVTNNLINQVSSASQFYQGNTTNYLRLGGNSNLVSGTNSPKQFINYSYSALQGVYNAAFSFNSAQNNNAYQFIDATVGFLNNLIIYYGSMNNINTANIKLNLYLMVYQLQQIQSNLFKNSNQYSVQKYVTQVPTTLITLGNILNNTVDQLISLNPTLNQTLYIANNTEVNYFQS